MDVGSLLGGGGGGIMKWLGIIIVMHRVWGVGVESDSYCILTPRTLCYKKHLHKTELLKFPWNYTQFPSLNLFEELYTYLTLAVSAQS